MADHDIFVTSLRNRIRAMNELWERAISDLTLEQVNHHERDGVLPIAFQSLHPAQDQSVSGIRQAPADLGTGYGGEPDFDALGREETVEAM
jgi:hypothetical protein